jgi:spore coat polysaccharide biosynthesis predicted glycosyltransferase SpsG
MNYQFLKTKKTIFFRVDGDSGNNAGLGHIYRSLKIYFFLKSNFNREYNFIFLMKNYDIGKKIIKNLTNERIIIFNNIKNVKFKKSDVVIIDTLGAERKLLKKIYSANVKKIICFDETNVNKFSKGIIVNGIYFAKKKIFSKSKLLKIYQGPKYLILNDEFSKNKKISKFKKKINVLVSSGGADKKSFLYKTTSILKNIPNFNLIVLVGNGVKKSNLIYKFKKKNNIKLVINTKNVKKYLDSADITFVSGGTVMFESISCGKITFVCKTYDHQKYAINYFKKKKLIKYIGPVINLQKKKIIKSLKNLNELKENNKINFYKAIKLIDGKGLFRVNAIIKKLLS